jgi:hypothetical protein
MNDKNGQHYAAKIAVTDIPPDQPVRQQIDQMNPRLQVFTTDILVVNYSSDTGIEVDTP